MRKQSLIVVILSCFVAASGIGEERQAARTPKEVIELFMKMDADGGRLTTEGWHRGANFFLKPGSPQKKTTMLVIADLTVGNGTISGDQAEVWTEYMALGKLDSFGYFTRSVGLAGGSSKYPVKGPTKFREPFRLRLSSEYWKLTNNGTLTLASGLPEWRIEAFQPERRITIETAMRYLRTLRDSSSDPATKKNATRAIAALKRLQTAK